MCNKAKPAAFVNPPFFGTPCIGRFCYKMVKHVKIQIITVQTLGHLTDQILKICKIHRKWRVKQTSVLFCKYLRNQSSDLYEI